MKAVCKPFLMPILALVMLLSFTSCEDEEAKLERNLIEVQDWEGWLPYDGYSHNDYYTIISFYPGGEGFQSIYRNDDPFPSLERRFNWGWSDRDYAVLILDFGYSGCACIDVTDVSYRRLIGYYYESYDEFIYNKEYYRRTDRDDKYISFTPSM